MKRQNIAICISILALVVSSISLLLTYQNSKHDRLVAFEQRKQEVQQLFMEGELLSEKLERIVLEHVKNDKTPELREDAAKIWKMATNLNQQMKSQVTKFKTLPATSNTTARLMLEEFFTDQKEINRKFRESLELAKYGHGSHYKNEHP